MMNMSCRPKLAGMLVVMVLLACDDTLFGLSESVEISTFERELVVVEEMEQISVSLLVGISNESPYPVGFSRCEVALQERQPTGWETVAGILCFNYELTWVEPGSATSGMWGASRSFSDGWIPTTSSEYRVVASVRAPDNEPHSVYSAPFVLEPTFQ